MSLPICIHPRNHRHNHGYKYIHYLQKCLCAPWVFLFVFMLRPCNTRSTLLTAILSAPYIVVNYRPCVAQQVSRTLSSCITDRLARRAGWRRGETSRRGGHGGEGLLQGNLETKSPETLINEEGRDVTTVASFTVLYLKASHNYTPKPSPLSNIFFCISLEVVFKVWMGHFNKLLSFPASLPCTEYVGGIHVTKLLFAFLLLVCLLWDSQPKT